MQQGDCPVAFSASQTGAGSEPDPDTAAPVAALTIVVTAPIVAVAPAAMAMTPIPVVITVVADAKPGRIAITLVYVPAFAPAVAHRVGACTIGRSNQRSDAHQGAQCAGDAYFADR